MALFRQNLNSGMNFLRRHFSSDDLYQDRDDGRLDGGGGDSHRMNLPGRKPLPSGPSFPTLSSVQDMTRGFLSHAAAAASSVTDAVSSVASGSAGVGGGMTGWTSSSVTPPPRRVIENKEHCKILLIIDDKHNDWSVTLSFLFSLLSSLSINRH